ncbi:MAG TPA: ATP phosphoribosyltransferase regulatory subunit, partial [Candidatus Norongarragalinales archaeon]|nr:ATP phosphoribosyltransferase regulatory subunit [Candidatus Norongarragalinales archaeon]
FVYCEKIRNEPAQKGISDLKKLFELLDAYGAKAELFPTLARGLNYYTGTVYEVFLKQGAMTSSLAAGGRYDEMVGKFSGKEKVPAVGISFGLDVICEALKEKGEMAQSFSSVYVFGIGDVQKDTVTIAQTLRNAGIACLLDLSNKGVSKNLDFASRQHFSWVILVGEREIKQGHFTLKNLKSGQESKLSLPQIILHLKKG